MNPRRSRSPILGIALTAVLIGGVALAAAPLEAQRPPVRRPAPVVQAQPTPGIPCCPITAIDVRGGLVTAQNAATGESFRFRVTDARLLRGLTVGQKVYRAEGADRVGITPALPCCDIVAAPSAGAASDPAVLAAAGMDAVRIVNILRPTARIVSYDAATQTVTAEDLATRRRFTIDVGSSQGGLVSTGSAATSGTEYRRGQIISTDLQGKFAAATGFPINASQENEIGASSRKMATGVVVSSNGRIDGTTRTWTSEALRGFTGAVEVVVTDIAGNILYRTQVRSYGVDGTAHPGDSDRTERWTEQVPADALNSAAAVVIAHHHDPKNRIPGAAAWIADNWTCAWEIYQAFAADEDGEGGQEAGQEGGFGAVDAEGMEQAEELMEACKKVFG